MELEITAQGGEQVVSDGSLAAHLEILDVTDLLDGAVVLLDEGFPTDGKHSTPGNGSYVSRTGI